MAEAEAFVNINLRAGERSGALILLRGAFLIVIVIVIGRFSWPIRHLCGNCAVGWHLQRNDSAINDSAIKASTRCSRLPTRADTACNFPERLTNLWHGPIQPVRSQSRDGSTTCCGDTPNGGCGVSPQTTTGRPTGPIHSPCAMPGLVAAMPRWTFRGKYPKAMLLLIPFDYDYDYD